MVKMTALMSLAVLVLTVLLFWKGSGNSRAPFQFGFVLGFATFVVVFFFRTGSAEWAMRFQMDSATKFIWIPFVLSSLLPFVLILETGAIGYRAFASPVRYVPLVIAIFGAVGIVASFLVPLFRRR